MQLIVNKLVPAVGLLVALTGTNVHAQSPAESGLPLVVTITATGVVQGDSSENDNGKTDVITTKSTKVKLSTQDIIKLIGENLGVSFSNNAKLVYQDGSMSVVDGNNTVDASANLEIDLDPNGFGVWSGTDSTDDNTGAETQKDSGTYAVKITFDDMNGDSFEVNGVASENVSIGKPDQNGNQRASDSISMKVSGDGQLAGSNLVGSATVKATATGTL